MADNTLLNPGSGGDTVRTEDVGAGVKIMVGKTHTGGQGVDGGPVAVANPFPVVLCSGSSAFGTVTNPMFVTGTIQSGSVSGLLVGGVAVSLTNPVPMTGTFGQVVGGVPVAGTNPLPVILFSGSNAIGGASNPLSVTGSITVIESSGSVTGLLVGGVAVGFANPLPVSGAMGDLVGGVPVSFSNPMPISGAIGQVVGGVPVSLANPLPVYSAVEGGGQILSGTTIQNVRYAFGDFGTSGSANQVISPQGAGNKIRVLSVHLMSPSNVLIRWLSTGSAGSINNISGLFPVPSNGGFVLPHNQHGWFQTNANEGLNLSLSSAVSCGLVLTWIISS